MNVQEPKIVGLFPTPLYLSNINRSLTETEINFVDKCKNNSVKNDGNTTSSDSYILNNVELKEIKKSLEIAVQDYFNQVLSSTDSFFPYITQSWINYTETNQYHHRHIHTHSLVSGVFYIKCHDELDRIEFYKNKEDRFFNLQVKEFNTFNATDLWFPVKTGDIVLFPSTLTHGVDSRERINTRISLAFNVFVKGTIGRKDKFSELIL
jgi:uncharacterized protein (TIGR02466 family)